MSVDQKEVFNSLDQVHPADNRGAKKRDNLKIEKWMRQIKLGHNQCPKPGNTQDDKTKKIDDNDSDNDNDNDNSNQSKKDDSKQNSRKTKNLISNPKKNKSRTRTDPPPPKSKRSDQGINRGNPGGCSICRPKIHKRMHQAAGIRSEIRKLKNDQTEKTIDVVVNNTCDCVHSMASESDDSDEWSEQESEYSSESTDSGSE